MTWTPGGKESISSGARTESESMSDKTAQMPRFKSESEEADWWATHRELRTVERAGHLCVSLLPSSPVDLAPMSNACDADELGCVVDDIHHPPVTHPEAPLIFVAFELFTSRGPWHSGQSLDFLNNASEHTIRQGFEFLLCGRLHLNGITTHACARFLPTPL